VPASGKNGDSEGRADEYMSNDASAYLVVRRKDGFGDVFPLTEGERYTLGRAPTCRLVLKDELCSREHAEVYETGGQWRLRDMSSLNGSRLNGRRVEAEIELTPRDEILLGKTQLVFVEEMGQLPDIPAVPEDGATLAIRLRLGQTRFLTPVPPPNEMDRAATSDPEKTAPPSAKHSLSRALSQLYRLALDMASAASYEAMVRIVLDGLLEGIPAEVGAILTVKEGRELEVTAHRHRDPSIHTYIRVSEFVSNEVMASKEAILAEDIARDRYLRDRESLNDMGVSSLICAPVVFGDKILGLIHLYCIDPHRTLDTEDLEFAMAVAKQLGTCTFQMRRQDLLSKENDSLRAQLRLESELVGKSPPMNALAEQIKLVAATNATVLIRGESGSGKELIARAVHYSSSRKDGPFVCLNCAALTETLLESELFGHEKGSFTGATEKKIGKFEAADKGTIFLDEIGEMSRSTQAKFLRVLEGHPFERVGGQTPIRVDVRVLSATNRPLEKDVHDGSFRRDLFFRLQVVEIEAPALRDHADDIGQLADHFLKRFVSETGRKIRGFTPNALKKMQDYHWPGNVRELRNVVERAVTLAPGPYVDSTDIWLSNLEGGGQLTPSTQPFRPMSLEDVEKRFILDTLHYTDWNKSQAAGILGIERSTLDRKIKAYELKKP
jgi:Nif-specific regulatory protein